MLSKKLTEALNDQINYEFYSAHLYLSMAAYCYNENLDGFANWFLVQNEEERFHAMKLFNYINQRGAVVELKEIPAPKTKFNSLQEIFDETLKHEQLVTKRFYDLTDMAMAEKDYATVSALEWFNNEQIEEEATVNLVISKLKLVEGPSLYLLDQELASRTFVAPAE
ncbi:ferritin [Clostridium sp. Marseille-Q7071]